MISNIDQILDAVCLAIEGIVPDVRPKVSFKRWTSGNLETAPIELRERSFQLRMGKSLTPRTLSSSSRNWQRAELIVAVGYNFKEPRQNDNEQNNVGVHTLPWIDHRSLVNCLVINNPFAQLTDVKRLLLLDAETPTGTGRVWRFDLEWAESF